MDWQGLTRRIHAEQAHNMHVLTRCEHAIVQAREALQILAGHGYPFYLAEGNGEKYPEWPKRMYHVDACPNGRMVTCEAEAEELGAGWFDSLLRAQFWDGMETQFNGRGGVPKTPRPPAIIYDRKVYISEEEALRIAIRLEEIEKFKAAHKWEEPAAASEVPASSTTKGVPVNGT